VKKTAASRYRLTTRSGPTTSRIDRRIAALGNLQYLIYETNVSLARCNRASAPALLYLPMTMATPAMRRA
jgi:hypothetical protein